MSDRSLKLLFVFLVGYVIYQILELQTDHLRPSAGGSGSRSDQEDAFHKNVAITNVVESPSHLVLRLWPKDPLANVTVKLQDVYDCKGLRSVGGQLVVRFNGCFDRASGTRRFRIEDAGDLLIEISGEDAAGVRVEGSLKVARQE